MKRTSLYVSEEVLASWAVYAKIRGAHMSRNKVIEEISKYLLCPDSLDTDPETIREALKKAKEEILKEGLGKLVQDGSW